MEPSGAHLLLPGCGTQGGHHYSLWASFLVHKLQWWSSVLVSEWLDCARMSPSPLQGLPEAFPGPGPRVEVATAVGPLSLSILFPVTSTLTGCWPLSAFSLPPSAGRNLVCRFPRPTLGEPSTEQASDQSLCKECSLRLLDRPLSPSLSETTLCSLRSPPYLVIPAWSRGEPQCLTPSCSLGNAEQVVTPIPWMAACWAHLGAQGKVTLLHGEKRYQSHPWAGPLRVGANQTKVLMSRS